MDFQSAFNQSSNSSANQTPKGKDFNVYSPDLLSQSPYSNNNFQSPFLVTSQIDFSQNQQTNVYSPVSQNFQSTPIQIVKQEQSQSDLSKDQQLNGYNDVFQNQDPNQRQISDKECVVQQFNPDQMSPGKKIFKLNSFCLQVEVTNTPPIFLSDNQKLGNLNTLTSSRKLNFYSSPIQNANFSDCASTQYSDNKQPSIATLSDGKLQPEAQYSQYQNQQNNFLQFQQYQQMYLQQNQQVCKCQNSRCLQRYCVCFGKNQYCNQFCKCLDCNNTQQYQNQRNEAIQKATSKNPNAFKPLVQKQVLSMKGCNCKKTKCTKGYCDCYQAGIPCTELCKCTICQNKQNLKRQKVDNFQNVQQSYEEESGEFFF